MTSIFHAAGDRSPSPLKELPMCFAIAMRQRRAPWLARRSDLRLGPPQWYAGPAACWVAEVLLKPHEEDLNGSQNHLFLGELQE